MGPHTGRGGQTARPGDCPVDPSRYPRGLLRLVYPDEQEWALGRDCDRVRTKRAGAKHIRGPCHTL